MNNLTNKIINIIKNNTEYQYIKIDEKINIILSEFVPNKINLNKNFNSYKIKNFKLFTTLKNVDKISRIILILIEIMKKIFGKEIYHEVDIVLYPSNYKKYFPKKEFTPKNINSGYTSYPNQIVIFRKEEIIKVLIHEFLHLYKTHPFHYNEKFDLLLKKQYCIENNNSLNLYEAYVEVFAVIINSCFYSIHNKKNIKTILKQELIHSRLNAYYSLNTYKPFKENTNAFSYLIIKYALFNNFDNLIKVLDDNYNINNEFLFMELVFKSLLLLKDEKVNKPDKLLLSIHNIL